MTAEPAGGPPRVVGHKASPRTLVGTFARWIALIIFAAVFLVPFYLIVRNAFSTDAEITAPNWTFFPTHIQWGNFTEVFRDPDLDLVRALVNSAIIAVVVTGVSLVVAALAGYGLARIPYRHKNIIFYLIVLTLMIPGAVTFVPSYVLISSLGWLNSLRGLIVPLLFSGFATFLFRQFFLNFPKELEEAARVDGLGYWGAFWRIVAPNSLAFSAALAVIGFIGSWNAFLWPLVIAGNNPLSFTVQVALSSLITAQTINVHELFMASAISILPLVIVFVALQRLLVQGVAQTGIKG